MRIILATTLAASVTLAGASGAVAKTCHDAYAAWKQEALKDGTLQSTIHTGKRVYIFRKEADKIRGRMRNLKGSDPACKNYLAWLAAETAKTKKMVPADRRAAFANGDKTSPVAASGLVKSNNKADFMDRPLYDRKALYVGTVDDVIYVEGKPRYLVVSRDNFLGSADHVYLVPVNVVRTTRKKDAFVVGTFRDQFYGKYPKYRYEDMADVRKKAESDKAFQKNLDDRYKGVSAFGQ